MTTVELVVTEAKIWARGATTHWDVPPSIVLGSNNSDLVVGEPLTTPTQVVSAVQYLMSDHIAVPPRVPSSVEALTAVVAAIVDSLGVAVPCDRLVCVHPTAWGARSLEMFATVAQRFAREVTFEPCAVRASEVDTATRRSRRTAILEFGLLSTTATTVVYDANGTHIEAVEAEPNLAAVELTAATGRTAFTDLLARLLTDRPTDVLQVFGTTDPEIMTVVGEVAESVAGSSIAISPLTGTDVARRPQQQMPYTPSIPPARSEWMQPLRERAAATHPVDRRPLYLAAVAAVAVIASVTAGIVLWGGGEDPAPTANAEPSPTHTVAPTTTSPPTTPRSATETIGRITLRVPAGWQRAATSSPATRVDFSPESGARQRITIAQQTVAADAGYDDIAADLTAQTRNKPQGTVSEIRRDVVFAGRPGLSYEERPLDGSEVRWHVLVERGVQVSVGCQFLAGRWDEVSTACEQAVSAIRIDP
ncbi:type VII secretion-associated protein [Nocardia asteroides]|uniref:type VII secretion-associated protein n=1 Tax=Nocardia asteroides TaxID=1824 RepID=UPI001E5D822D|nr:type VII secretion-associated protein [Nocardia asteroides]UGT53527.1 type VII secretion-associated protein [Nocardia asteroides]